MKNLILTLSVLCVCFTTSAQRHNAIGINFNIHNSKAPRVGGPTSDVHYGFPSLEYQRRKDKKIWSFELAKIHSKRINAFFWNGKENQLQYFTRNTEMIARVQKQHLVRDSSKRLQPYWGACFSPFFTRSQRTPLVSTIYPITTTSAGISHHFSLGTYYNFGRYYLQANALIGIASIGGNWQNIKDPSLVSHAQQYGIFDFNMFRQDHFFRLGIGMKL